MFLITLAIIAYLGLGWPSVIVLNKEKKLIDELFNIVLFAGLLTGVYYVAGWLDVSEHVIVLLGVAIGAITVRVNNAGLRDNVPFLLLLGVLGYYGYQEGFLSAVYLLVLAAITSFVVQTPLLEMPKLNSKITPSGSLKIAYLLSVVSLGNIILLYFVYGI